MCLYACALLRTNLFSVTIARVVLTQIRTRCLINEIAFCLRGSSPTVIQTGYAASAVVWGHEPSTFRGLQPRFALVCTPCDEQTKHCSWVVYVHKSLNRPRQCLGLWPQKRPCCQHAREHPEGDRSLPGTCPVGSTYPRSISNQLILAINLY